MIAFIIILFKNGKRNMVNLPLLNNLILKVINMVIFVHMLALSHSRPLKNMHNIWQTHMDGLHLTHEFFIKMDI